MPVSPSAIARSSSPLRLTSGLLLSAAIAWGAFALKAQPGFGLFSPMILAIVLGMIFHNLIGTPFAAKPGVAFSMRRILRFAIILLGLQLTFSQVREVGLAGVAIIAVTLTCTFVFTVWMGRLLGIERKLAELIAAGTSVCGASAIIATNTVTEAHDEDVAYAVAMVTVFGSIAMFTYPLVYPFLSLSPEGFGLWAGASIHEIAQVVAAAFQAGTDAGHFGTIAKLTRVMMLAPLVMILGALAMRRHGAKAGRRKAPMPWFVLGFLALILVNSVFTIPAAIKMPVANATTFLLAMALGAMGLETDVRKMLARGIQPLLLGAIAFLFIAGLSLMLVRIFA